MKLFGGKANERLVFFWNNTPNTLKFKMFIRHMENAFTWSLGKNIKIRNTGQEFMYLVFLKFILIKKVLMSYFSF